MAAVAAPSPIHQLSIRAAFERLSWKQKLYAHHLARIEEENGTNSGERGSAAWKGSKIVMRQVSPESINIYEFILELHSSCLGDWKDIGHRCSLRNQAVEDWLEYAAKFLSNLAHQFCYAWKGTGNQKFVPAIDRQDLKKLASVSQRALELYAQLEAEIYIIPPYNLGFPSTNSQSSYYPSDENLTQDEIALVSPAAKAAEVYLENTRLRKIKRDNQIMYEILQASINPNECPLETGVPGTNARIRTIGGDHAEELRNISSSLGDASEYATEEQKAVLLGYIQSFASGNLKEYRDALRTWVADKGPEVENVFGFVEPYRDPYGVRAEFEGIVTIADAEETRLLRKLVDSSTPIIKTLPWTLSGTNENNGKGPFESALFEPPDFASLHSLAYCSSIIFPGINLPNYNDIREETGSKNLIIANRMSLESNSSKVSPFVHPSEAQTFQKHKFDAYYLWVVLHEIFGHGTGKMLKEDSPGQFNFDINNPPINPLTGTAVSSWYKPKQTWNEKFEDLATTLDECRAELVGAYLIDNSEVLGVFGFSERSEITADDLTYNTYMQLGIAGLVGLQNYDDNTKKWGSAHSQAHFAILKCMLQDGQGFLRVESDYIQNLLYVRIDRSRIISHGKPALGNMLLRLHIYRCTADVDACRKYYEELSEVDELSMEWRRIVLAQEQPKWLFVHANTFLNGHEVTLKEYPPTKEGIIQSWAERLV